MQHSPHQLFSQPFRSEYNLFSKADCSLDVEGPIHVEVLDGLGKLHAVLESGRSALREPELLLA